MLWREFIYAIAVFTCASPVVDSSLAAEKVDCSQRADAFLEMNTKYSRLHDEIEGLKSKIDALNWLEPKSGICQRASEAIKLSEAFAKTYNDDYKSQCGKWAYFFSSTIEDASDLKGLFGPDGCK